MKTSCFGGPALRLGLGVILSVFALPACGDDMGNESASAGTGTTAGPASDSQSESNSQGSESNSESESNSQGTNTGGGGEDQCTMVDLLFVIDDSGSMLEEQDKLTDAFPQFMVTVDAELVKQKNVDYRVGVISVDMSAGLGRQGRLLHEPGRLACSDVPTGKWIEQGAVEDVATQFKCVASIDGGNGIEMPLESLRAALFDRTTDAEAYNEGFLRDDALLVVMIITDEDDQSVLNTPPTWDGLFEPGPITPVQVYWDQLVQLKGGDPEKLVMVALSADEDAGCDSLDGTADMAPRIHELLDLAPNSHWDLICNDDYNAPLQEALDVIEASCDGFNAPD